MKKSATTLFALILFSFLMSGCTQLAVEALNKQTLTQISVRDNKMYLMGDLNSRSFDQVKEALTKNPDVDTLVFTANPGSLDDDTTLRLAEYIRSQRLRTHLTSQSVIASGAVDLYLSGKIRTMEKGAMLGVHSWSDGFSQAKDIPRSHPDHRKYTDYYLKTLGNDEFYWYTIYAAPADSIFWMEERDIIRYGLLTDPILKPAHGKIPFGEEFHSLRENILEN